MHRLSVRNFFIFIVFIFPFISLLKPSYAEFQLGDAVKTFGEKRFYKGRPTKLQVGPVKVHPKVRTRMELDDNILLEDEDGRGDIIFSVQPGVVLELPIDTHQIAIGYEADIEVFTKSRHAKQSDQNQNMFALIDLKFPNFYINVLERLTETSGRSGTTFTGRIPRIDNDINPKIGFRYKRFIWETGFRHYTRAFRRQIDDSLDFQLVEWTSVLFYDLFARVKALADVSVSQIDYDDNRDRQGTFTQTRVGFEGELMPNLIAKARVGVQFRNYEVESKPDFNSWVASVSLDYEMRENLRINASFDRVPIEANFNTVNFFKRHIMRLGYEYDLTPRWTVFQSFKYYRDSYTERASVSLRSGFRRDNHITLQSGIRYTPYEWLMLELRYDLAHRNSNFNTFDYTGNRLSFASTLSY